MEEIWNEIITRPKWYAGVRNCSGGFYTAQAARNLKVRFKAGLLSREIIERVLNSHGYYLEEKWVYRG